ncbi:MAG: class I SAM-dependent methyltransferase [Thermoplasmata archaeon]|nr:class I SAM-dependent methyltransferase [Thermoplasmata archaeon]
MQLRPTRWPLSLGRVERSAGASGEGNGLGNIFLSPYFIGGAVLFVFAGAVAYFWLVSFLFGAGYQGAPRRSVEAMFRLADIRPSDTLYELGAGVGAVVFPAAREYGAKVVAVEIEPLRVLILRLRRAVGPGAERIELRRANMYALDLRPASVVTAFLWPGAMARLRQKFENELRPGTRVVSRCHPIIGWTPTQYDRAADVYFYRWPDAIATSRSGG